ncbi:hypothetical protein BV898_19633 [Hypsibius exemplaris]|uniref:Uncharacterized protein n=1 Tax=Hypsibius exemplaris TaxID=2072580 RepID=A0A9X6NJC1_HYPEX|nr:hypothetical protein BV898_19633 [Hypsibius exemplaris]
MYLKSVIDNFQAYDQCRQMKVGCSFAHHNLIRVHHLHVQFPSTGPESAVPAAFHPAVMLRRNVLIDSLNLPQPGPTRCEKIIFFEYTRASNRLGACSLVLSLTSAAMPPASCRQVDCDGLAAASSLGPEEAPYGFVELTLSNCTRPPSRKSGSPLRLRLADSLFRCRESGCDWIYALSDDGRNTVRLGLAFPSRVTLFVLGVTRSNSAFMLIPIRSESLTSLLARHSFDLVLRRSLAWIYPPRRRLRNHGSTE